jgi:hypothetical protein
LRIIRPRALAQVAITFAGFSGVVVAFRLRGAQAWSPTELRILWFLLGDSFLVLFFSLLPLPLALANWSPDALWGLCNALLGSYFIVADLLAFLGERRSRGLWSSLLLRSLGNSQSQNRCLLGGHSVRLLKAKPNPDGVMSFEVALT